MAQSTTQQQNQAIGWWSLTKKDLCWQCSTHHWANTSWLRLPFGLMFSADVFQESLNSVLQGVNGTTGCVNDVLARHANYNNPNVNPLRLLEVARMNDIVFNAKKLQFKSNNCSLFWTYANTTRYELKIDERKVDAIKKMSAPRAKQGLQSFQGMVNYLKHYSICLMKL